MKTCIPLSELEKNKKAKILNYSTEDFPIKLIEMGLLPDTELTILAKAPFHGPIMLEYGKDHSCLSLRIEEAKCINIEVL